MKHPFAFFCKACLLNQIVAVAMEADEEGDPFACPLSKHADGNHSRAWFDGGICQWCGKT